MAWSIDERLAPFIRVSLVEDGEFFAGALFHRKFGDPLPTFGHHIVAFHRRDESTFAVASYLHLWTQGTIGLVGGGCTDGRVLRAMDPRELRLVNEAGGLLRQTLLFCFARFEAGLEAFFGHCGDDRAKEVDLAAGFEETGVPYLLVRPNGALAPARRHELVQQAHAIGPF
ncbi:MAG: hypothetical protein AB1689_14495 [Thermodesulfobacteriota bacterium]